MMDALDTVPDLGAEGVSGDDILATTQVRSAGSGCWGCRRWCRGSARCLLGTHAHRLTRALVRTPACCGFTQCDIVAWRETDAEPEGAGGGAASNFDLTLRGATATVVRVPAHGRLLFAVPAPRGHETRPPKMVHVHSLFPELNHPAADARAGFTTPGESAPDAQLLLVVVPRDKGQVRSYPFPLVVRRVCAAVRWCGRSLMRLLPMRACRGLIRCLRG